MYAIMRTKKHAAGGGLYAALQHLYRERETPNANASMTPNNISLIGRNDEHRTMGARQRLEAELNLVSDNGARKFRKNTVVAVEYMMTASPEYWSNDPKERERQAREFADRSVKWIQKQYPEGKIFAAEVHMDETSPHVSLFVTPTVRKQMKKGERLTLCAKDILGGSQRLSAHQTSFYQAVQDLGLERGTVKSKARHTQVNTFYGRLTRASEDAKQTQHRLIRRLENNEPLISTGKYYKEHSRVLAKRVAELESANAMLRKEFKDVERTSNTRKRLLDMRVSEFRSVMTDQEKRMLRQEVEHEFVEREAAVKKNEHIIDTWKNDHSKMFRRQFLDEQRRTNELTEALNSALDGQSIGNIEHALKSVTEPEIKHRFNRVVKRAQAEEDERVREQMLHRNRTQSR